MMNLWDETIEELNRHNLKWEDVDFAIVTDAFYVSKDDFETFAKRINYDEGFGLVVIDPRLKIVGDNWWLERAEYDGKEWWEFKTMPSVALPRGSVEGIKVPYDG